MLWKNKHFQISKKKTPNINQHLSFRRDQDFEVFACKVKFVWFDSENFQKWERMVGRVVAHVLSLQNTARPKSLPRARGVSNYLDAGVLKCLLTPHINSRGHFRRWIGACCHRLAWQIIWGGASTKLPGSRTAQGCWSRSIYLNADAVLVGIISTRWLPAMGNWHSCVRICRIYIFLLIL